MVNGTDLLNNPLGELTSPFTDLLGTGFWLIPLSFICIALYIKTRNVTVVSLFMLSSGLLLSSSSIWVGYTEASFLYIVFTALGLVGTIANLFFMKE